jgi:RNA polymerase sigma factor (TIGR02999 family)
VNETTRLLWAIENGDDEAADELLPLVYDELHRLAAEKMEGERPGQTLQTTALVNEAYVRLVDHDRAQHWNSRRHFFAAAAEAMRRILVDRARRRHSGKRGGGWHRVPLDGLNVADTDHDGEPTDEILAVDEALTRFAALDPAKAELVRLRYFAGLSVVEAAELLGISRATAERHWHYARTWLYAALTRNGHDAAATGSIRSERQ